MQGTATIAALAAAAVLSSGAPAQAADLCVDPERPDCYATIGAAVDDATAQDRIVVAAGIYDEPPVAAPAGRPVRIAGAGPSSTTLLTSLALLDPGSAVSGLTIREAAVGLELAGRAQDIAVEATETGVVLAGGRLTRVDVEAPVGVRASGASRIDVARLRGGSGVIAGAGTLELQDAEIAVAGAGADGIAAGCGASVQARHVSVIGTGRAAARAACDGADLELRDSVVWGDFAAGALDGDAVATIHAAYAADPDHPHGPTDLVLTASPFADGGDARPGPGSPLLDAGDPAPLGAGEWPVDRDGLPRIADGNGDGTLRRDIGAYERQPPAVPPLEGNLLLNHDAEGGELASSAGAAPPVPQWTRSGLLTAVRWGVVDGDFLMPTGPTGAVLGGGNGYFAGGPGGTASAVQRVDVAASARAIDAGGATARLAGLLGGYGSDADAATLRAVYRDAAGQAIGSLAVGPVTPADRANTTNLLARSAAGTIPVGTRAVDITLTAEQIGTVAEAYNDAYADNLGLALSVPGVVDPDFDPDGPVVPGTKPFAGVKVLYPRANLRRNGTMRIRLACPSATVGRCRGTLALTARLRRFTTRLRIASAPFSLAPGVRRTIVMRVRRAARRSVRGRAYFRARLRADARDGQGLRRQATIPLRVRLSPK